jgi:hypothetical protein
MMESYLLKSSLSLLMLYGAFSIVLRYQFNYQFNRCIGLGCVLFSTTYPFLNIEFLANPRETSRAFYSMVAEATDFQNDFSNAVSEDTSDLVLLCYGIGVCIFLCRFIYGLAGLLQLYWNSDSASQWGFTVVAVEKKLSPFTFFNFLFIGNQSIPDIEMKAVVLHEQVHRDQRHSLDIVFLEAMTVVFWFNPAIWLFRNSIKAQHEYFVDERVLAMGIDPLAYQVMLFNAGTGSTIKFTSHLSKKKTLVKRFKMMTRTRSKSRATYFSALLFPALMCGIVFFGAFKVQMDDSQIDKIAQYQQGEQALYRTIFKLLKYPEAARRENRSGSVYVTFTVNHDGKVENVEASADVEGHLLYEVVVVGHSPAPGKANGVDDVLKEECVSVVKRLGEFYPAERDGNPVSSVQTLPVKFHLN